MSENDLIRACIEGERSAQQELFERFAGKMMTVCKRFARHHLEAEDMMQEGFVRVFTNLEKFKFSGSFEGWVRRIMVNNALKMISKKSFSNEQIGLEPYHDETTLPTIYSKLSEEELLNLVSELPDGYRTVFNLYAIEGYSHKEIGEKLEIGESTSRSQLVKARRMLMDKIKELQKIAV